MYKNNKKTEITKINTEFNHHVKLQQYRKEHQKEIEEYRNGKAFLNVIKKKQYKPEDYKE